MNCPKCSSECERDSADIGIGVIYGPYGCPGCGWSEDSEYDRSDGPSPAQKENPDWFVDQWGGMTKIKAIVDRAEVFGIPRYITEEVFRVKEGD